MLPAGFAWSYNAQLYNETYYPDSSSGLYLCIATVIGGSVGLVMGGCVSDRIVAKFGIHARVWIIVVSQVTSSSGFRAGFEDHTLILFFFSSSFCALVGS